MRWRVWRRSFAGQTAAAITTIWPRATFTSSTSNVSVALRKCSRTRCKISLFAFSQVRQSVIVIAADWYLQLDDELPLRIDNAISDFTTAKYTHTTAALVPRQRWFFTDRFCHTIDDFADMFCTYASATQFQSSIDDRDASFIPHYKKLRRLPPLLLIYKKEI